MKKVILVSLLAIYSSLANAQCTTCNISDRVWSNQITLDRPFISSTTQSADIPISVAAIGNSEAAYARLIVDADATHNITFASGIINPYGLTPQKGMRNEILIEYVKAQAIIVNILIYNKPSTYYNPTSMYFLSSSSQYLNAPHHSIINLSKDSPFSFSFWTRINTNATQNFLSKDSSSRGYQCRVNASGNFQFSLTNTTTTNQIVVTAPLFSLNAWHHVVVTYSGNSLASGVKIYFDGTSQTVTTVTNNLTSTIQTLQDLYIGTQQTLTNYLGSGTGAYMDEFSLYNTELTSGNVTTLYNGGTPNNLLSNSFLPVLWYKFDSNNPIDYSGSNINLNNVNNTAISTTHP